jgi:membrane protease YdiL (CAAX protease family)
MENISIMLILLISYASILFMFMAINRIRPGVITYDRPEQSSFRLFNYLHTITIIIMLLPAFFIKPLPISLLSFPDRITIEQAIIFLMSFGVIGFFPWKKFSEAGPKDDSISSPTIPVILYAFLRIIFLIVYEWFFRGLLLIGISAWAGIEWSIVINVLLYTIMHSHKSKKEMIGCVPLGLLLCVFTIWWQSIWPAIILHFEIAIMNEWPPLQQIISPQKQTAL